MAIGSPRPGRTGRKVLLTLWLLAPLAVVAAILPFVHRSEGKPDPAKLARDLAPAPEPVSRPVGDGRRTGGPPVPPGEPEMSVLDAGIVFVVRDATGRASKTTPILLACGANGWEPGGEGFVLTDQGDGLFRVALARDVVGDGFEYALFLGTDPPAPEVDPATGEARRRVVGDVDALPRDEDKRANVEVRVEGWGE